MIENGYKPKNELEKVISNYFLCTYCKHLNLYNDGKDAECEMEGKCGAYKKTFYELDKERVIKDLT